MFFFMVRFVVVVLCFERKNTRAIFLSTFSRGSISRLSTTKDFWRRREKHVLLLPRRLVSAVFSLVRAAFFFFREEEEEKEEERYR